MAKGKAVSPAVAAVVIILVIVLVVVIYMVFAKPKGHTVSDNTKSELKGQFKMGQEIDPTAMQKAQKQQSEMGSGGKGMSSMGPGVGKAGGPGAP